MKKLVRFCLSIIVGIAVIYISVLVIIFSGGTLFERLSEPTIQNGAFPLKLEYIKDEELFVENDILICCYEGVKYSGSKMEKYRAWSAHLDSGREYIPLLEDEKVAIYIAPARQSQDVGAYFMGDTDSDSNTLSYSVPMQWDKINNQVRTISDDNLFESYQIKILGYEIAPPIENTFR